MDACPKHTLCNFGKNKNIQMRFSTTAIITLFVLIFSACKKETPLGQTPISPTVPQEYKEMKDVSYGSHERHKADIYLPAGRSANTATAILIHGGGWTTGDKWEMEPFIDTAMMRELNIAIVNMNYRLATATEFKHPAQVNDIGSLIDYLSDNAAQLHISSKRFALIGASAGGHLSLLYDYAFDTDNKVKAVVNCVGPTDFIVPEILTDTAQYLAVYSLLGVVHWENMPLWVSASPYQVAGTQSSPTALFMGTADNIVPTSQGIKLKARLDSLSVPSIYIQYDGAGHGWWPSSPYFIDTQNKIKQWLSTHLVQ